MTLHHLDTDIEIDKSHHFRVTKKPIPRFTSTIEVKRHDLYSEDEKEQYRRYPNYDSSLASIRLPSHVFWARSVMGSYTDLYILSPERSPGGSAASSAGSRKISPASTWGSQAAESGAEKDDE